MSVDSTAGLANEEAVHTLRRHSRVPEEAVLEDARRAGILVHVDRVRSQEDTLPKFVEQLTEAAGGRVCSAASERDLA